MAYIICEPCIGTKDTACVDVCPVDCIHPTREDDDFEEAELLYINPDECIDCGACEPACPVTAIFVEEDVPPEWQDYTVLSPGLVRRPCAPLSGSFPDGSSCAHPRLPGRNPRQGWPEKQQDHASWFNPWQRV